MDWPSLKKSGINITLRFATMLSKFVLVFILAKYLDTRDLGLYGIFFATVAFCLYLVGLDFYTFSLRDMLGRERSTWYSFCLSQFRFHLLSHAVGLPVFLVIFGLGFLPWTLAVWFFLLLLMGHLGTEMYRLLVAMGAPILASWSMFIRVGAWAYLLGALCWYDPSLLDIDYVWPAWAMGEFLGGGLAVWGLRTLRRESDGSRVAGRPWVREGLKVALPFFLGTIAMRGIYTADRYVLDYFSGREAVGIFSLFMGLAVSLQSFVESGVVSIHYPDIVASYKKGDYDRYRNGLKKMGGSILVILAVYAGCSLALLDPILELIGKSEFLGYTHVFWILLLSVSVLSLSSVNHFALYAMGRDRAIVTITVVAFASFMLLSLVLVPGYGLVGIALAHLVVMVEIFLLKFFVQRRATADLMPAV